MDLCEYNSILDYIYLSRRTVYRHADFSFVSIVLITIILGFDLYTWIFRQEKPGKESLILLVLSILLYSFFGIYDGPKTVNVLLVLFSLAVSVVIVLEMAIQIKLLIFKKLARVENWLKKRGRRDR